MKQCSSSFVSCPLCPRLCGKFRRSSCFGTFRILSVFRCSQRRDSLDVSRVGTLRRASFCTMLTASRTPGLALDFSFQPPFLARAVWGISVPIALEHHLLCALSLTLPLGGSLPAASHACQSSCRRWGVFSVMFSVNAPSYLRNHVMVFFPSKSQPVVYPDPCLRPSTAADGPARLFFGCSGVAITGASHCASRKTTVSEVRQVSSGSASFVWCFAILQTLPCSPVFGLLHRTGLVCRLRLRFSVSSIAFSCQAYSCCVVLCWL